MEGKATTGPRERREADVAQAIVVPEGDGLAGDGEVGGNERLHDVVVGEEEGARDLLEEGHAEALDATDINVTGAVQAGEGDLEVGGVVGDAELLGDVGKARLPRGEELVVVDLEGADGSHVQALQAVERGVADADLLDGGDTISAELDTLQRGESDPLDLIDLLKGVEADAGKALEALQLELAANLLDGRAAEGLDALRLLDDQVTLDLLGPVNADRAADVVGLLEDNVSLDDLAADLGILSRLDLDRLAARVLGYVRA